MARPKGVPEPPGLRQAERGITRLLELPNTIISQVESSVHQGMDRLPASMPQPLRRILFESQHDNFLEALLSDVVGEVPFAEFLIKPFRIRSAAKAGQVEDVSRHAVDWTLPIPFPANIRRYLRERLGR